MKNRQALDPNTSRTAGQGAPLSGRENPLSAAPTAIVDPNLPQDGLLSAVDLGSNSFHLIVARLVDGHLSVVDRLREPVRLAGGLGPDKQIDASSKGRALECLQRFGQRLRDFAPGSVRAVGTNTLRSARNGEVFRREAETVLGHRIEVIDGREEARLIYLGVAHALGGDRHRRLVVDIGGGSTELIVGEGFDPLFRESLFMGCVSLTASHFGGGKIDKRRMREAELAARIELEPLKARIRGAWWERAVGASGTVRAVARLLRAAGWCEHGISREGLRRLRKALIAFPNLDSVNLEGLRPERKPVLLGGVACLWAVFDELDIETMEVSDMALREGLLYDLHGRINHEDVRERTLRGLAETYRPDRGQANRVTQTALSLLAQVAEGWNLAGAETKSQLRWAAQIHEIGAAVSHNQHHKHGGYLLEHSDMAGFSNQEKATLAALVRGHRRKFPSFVFADLPDSLRTARMCRLLRIAVVLHRGRADLELPEIEVQTAGDRMRLDFAEAWLDDHPLTRADLEQEAQFLATEGLGLEFA